MHAVVMGTEWLKQLSGHLKYAFFLSTAQFRRRLSVVFHNVEERNSDYLLSMLCAHKGNLKDRNNVKFSS